MCDVTGSSVRCHCILSVMSLASDVTGSCVRCHCILCVMSLAPVCDVHALSSFPPQGELFLYTYLILSRHLHKACIHVLLILFIYNLHVMRRLALLHSTDPAHYYSKRNVSYYCRKSRQRAGRKSVRESWKQRGDNF